MLKKAFRYITKDIKRIPIGIKLIVFVIFLRTLGWGFVDPFFAIYLDGFSDNYTMIGAFVSFISVISLLTVIPLIRLADKVKDARIIEDGEIFYLFTIMAYVAAGFLHSLPVLIIAFILNGIAHPFVIVGAEAYIRKHGRKGGSSRAFGYYTALGNFGWILGMVIAAFLIPYYSFNTMFLFVLPSIVMSFFILPRIRERGLTSFFHGLRKYFHKTEDFKGIINDFRGLNRKMLFFLMLAFFDGMIVMFAYIFIPLFALTIDLSLKQIALLLTIMYVPFIFSFFFSEIADRSKKMSVIATGLFVGALSFILLSFVVHQLWVVVLASLISLSVAIIRPAYNGIITQLTPRKMLGEISGLNNLFVRLGHIVGPILSGVIADLYSIQVSFFLIAIIAFGLGIITILLRGYEYLPMQDEDVKLKMT